MKSRAPSLGQSLGSPLLPIFDAASLFQTNHVVHCDISREDIFYEDKHVVNEHHVRRKNVRKRCISVYHVTGLKETSYSKEGKKFRGCRCLLGRVVPLRHYSLLTCI